MKKIILTAFVSGICMIGFAQTAENDLKTTDQNAAKAVKVEAAQTAAPKITAQQQADAKNKIKANPNTKMQVDAIVQPAIAADAAGNEVVPVASKTAPVKTEATIRQKQAPKE